MNNRYVNYASISPILAEVRQAIDRFLDRYMMADFHYYTTLCELSDRIRYRYAELVGASAEDIALFPNSALALSTVMMGFPFEQGDNVIIVEGDFPSTSLPFTKLRRDAQIHLTVIEQAAFYADPVGTLAAAISPKTRCFVTSSVGYMSGVALPLKALAATCHQSGVKIIVDGTQGVGVRPVECDNWGIDFMVASSYKWLMAPLGVALSVISKDLQKMLQPTAAGWLSVEEPGSMLSVNAPFASSARRFEPGGRPILAMVGLDRALEYIMAVGPDEISEKTLVLTRYLYAELKHNGYTLPFLQTEDTASGIVSIAVPEHGEQLFEALKAKGFRTTYRLGMLRFSPYFQHQKKDIDALLAVLNRLWDYHETPTSVFHS